MLCITSAWHEMITEWHCDLGIDRATSSRWESSGWNQCTISSIAKITTITALSTIALINAQTSQSVTMPTMRNPSPWSPCNHHYHHDCHDHHDHNAITMQSPWSPQSPMPPQPVPMPTMMQESSGSCNVSGWGTLHSGLDLKQKIHIFAKLISRWSVVGQWSSN